MGEEERDELTVKIELARSAGKPAAADRRAFDACFAGRIFDLGELGLVEVKLVAFDAAAGIAVLELNHPIIARLRAVADNRAVLQSAHPVMPLDHSLPS